MEIEKITDECGLNSEQLEEIGGAIWMIREKQLKIFAKQKASTKRIEQWMYKYGKLYAVASQMCTEDLVDRSRELMSKLKGKKRRIAEKSLKQYEQKLKECTERNIREENIPPIKSSHTQNTDAMYASLI